MGCDVHFYAEVRESASAPWKAVLGPCESCDRTGVNKWEPKICTRCKREEYEHESGKCLFDHTQAVEYKHPPCYECHGSRESPKRMYRGRNYWLFYKLAGVRLGPDKPIDQPRGIPEDLSPQLAADAPGTDWHSHTWFMLSELLEQDWSREDDGGKVYANFVASLDAMKTLGDPDNVRAVLWFDN